MAQSSRQSNRELAESFVDANQALLRELSENITQAGISIPQFLVLTKLGGEEMTIGQLRQLLDVTLPSASLIVARLEKTKLVERFRSKDDRRVVYVCITRSGNLFVGRIAKAIGSTELKVPVKSAAFLKKLILPS